MRTRYLFRNVSQFNSFGIWVIFNNIKTGDTIGLHDHDFLELVIVEDGTGWHLCEDEKFNISAGNVFMVPLGIIHGYKSIDNLKVFSILFHADILKIFDNDLRKISGFQMLFHIEPQMMPDRRMRGNLRVDEKLLYELVKKLNFMLNEQKKKLPGFQMAQTLSFWEILLLISRNCYSSDDKYYHNASRISKVISFMESHFNEDLPLDSLVRLSGLSRSTFRRHFQETIGESPIVYLLKLRIKKATILLDSTNLSVAEIAFQCGFTDSNYFSHQFRKFWGFSPSAYRNNKKTIF